MSFISTVLKIELFFPHFVNCKDAEQSKNGMVSMDIGIIMVT